MITGLLCVVLLAAAWGCSDDDEGGINDPGGNNPPGGNTYSDDPVLQAGIEKGLEVGNALLAVAPRWAAGDLVDPPTKSALYNPACQCWTWEVVDGDPAANPFDYATWNFVATFYAGETAIEGPAGAESVRITMTYSRHSGFYSLEENGDSESTDFSVSLIVVIGPVGGDPALISGSGGAEFVSTGTVAGTFFERYGQFGVSIYLDLPATGCPVGTMSIDMMDEQEGPTLFSMGYDGTTTVHWTLSQGWQGENTIRGSETVVCGGTD
jgi:hypothetical protein